ncbi:MAG TPA: flagellar brake domain-containing protein [Bacillota bacterium]|nr:flagellar brake domain-containing protein [Bacillota bacterium]
MQLKIGDRLELEVLSGAYSGSYPSQVLNMGQKEVTVSIPIVRGHLVPLRAGSLLRVLIFKPDAAYEFASPILRRTLEAPFGLVLAMPDRLHRSQRREDVRVEVSIPVEILVFDSDNSDEWRVIYGRTRDLSGGGAKVEYSGDLKGTERLEMQLKLPGIEAIVLSCRYIRGDRTSKPGQSWMALRFDSIRERNKRQIIKFVFQKQQELRAKGLI